MKKFYEILKKRSFKKETQEINLISNSKIDEDTEQKRQKTKKNKKKTKKTKAKKAKYRRIV